MKKGYIYAILSAILFGSAGLFVKMSFNTGLSSTSLLIHQYTLAIILMFILLLILDRKNIKVTKHELKYLAILGVIGNTFMTVFYYMAFNYLPVALVNMLLYTCPIMVFIYEFFFQGVKFNRNKLIALTLAIVGCFLSLGLSSGKLTYSFIGIILALMSALFYAFMNICTEKYLSNVKPLKINAYATLFSLITLILIQIGISIFKGQDIIIYNSSLSFNSIMYITILAILCEIIPLTLLYAAINNIGAFKTSIIGNIEIPTSMILGYMFLQEGISIMQIFGALFIVLSVYLIKQ